MHACLRVVLSITHDTKYQQESSTSQHCAQRIESFFARVALEDACNQSTVAAAIPLWQQQLQQLKALPSISFNEWLLQGVCIFALRLLNVCHAESSPKCIHLGNWGPQAICCGPHSLARAAGAFGSAGQWFLLLNKPCNRNGCVLWQGWHPMCFCQGSWTQWFALLLLLRSS